MSQRDATIPMKVSALTVDPFTSLPVVILEDEVGRSRLAISVGLGEASALAAELDRIELERPMTHHLTCALLAKTGARVVAVEVSDLRDSTYYATVRVSLPDGAEVAQDARPSDALALALRVDAPIRVAAHVLDQVARFELPEDEPAPAVSEGERPAGDDLVTLGDDAFGKWKM